MAPGRDTRRGGDAAPEAEVPDEAPPQPALVPFQQPTPSGVSFPPRPEPPLRRCAVIVSNFLLLRATLRL